MADPLGGDQFDVEALAEVEVEKLMKQVLFIKFYYISLIYFAYSVYFNIFNG